MAGRLTKLLPAVAVAWAAAEALAGRRGQQNGERVVPAASRPVDTTARAVLARPDAQVEPAPPPSAAHQEEIPPQNGGTPGPGSPLQLRGRDWKASVKRAAREFKDDRATLTSAGMAFYWFLSVFPAMMALVGFLGLFNANDAATASIEETVRSALPGDAAKVLVEAVSGAADQSGGTSLVAALFGVALALWSASAGMVGMQMGLNVAYDVTTDRTFVKKRLVAFQLLVAMLVLGGVATAAIVFGAPLGDALRDNLPFGSAFVVLWTLMRWATGLAALTTLFATIYYLAPNRGSPRWVWVSPGGLLAAGIWLLASLGFSFYVSSFGKYAETYGSLAGVVVLLLWLYLTALAVVAGGELNAELERQSAARKEQVPTPP